MTYYLVCWRCQIAYPFSRPPSREYKCHLCNSKLELVEIEDGFAWDLEEFLDFDSSYTFTVRLKREHPAWKMIFEQGNSVLSWFEEK